MVDAFSAENDEKAKKQFADFLSYAAITMAEEYDKDSLKYFQQGTGNLNWEVLGVEYILNLASDVSSEYENRLTSNQGIADLVTLGEQILPILFKNGHEIAATDMLIELEQLQMIAPYVDSENYQRIFKYLSSYLEYTADATEFNAVLDQLYKLAQDQKDSVNMLRVAIRQSDKQKAL